VVQIIPRADAMFDDWMGGKTAEQIAAAFRVDVEVVEQVINSRRVPNTPQGRMELHGRRLTRVSKICDQLWNEIERGDSKHRHANLILFERFDARLDALNSPSSITRLDAPVVEAERQQANTSTDYFEQQIARIIAEQSGGQPIEEPPEFEAETDSGVQQSVAHAPVDVCEGE
jgi:hypothetical protein